MKDMEIICVDAGSTDGTRQIIDRFAGQDPRITVIHSEKKSYGYQLNLGIRNSSGEYIGFVETDDYVSPEMFETLYSKAEKFQLDCVRAGNFSFFMEGNKQVTVESRVLNENDPLNGAVICPLDYPEIIALDGTVWRGIYHRDLFEGKDIFHETDGAAYQDIGFSLQVFSRIRKLMYIPECLYYYRTDRPEASSLRPECLKFQYQEYSWLLDKIGFLMEKPEMKRAFFLRMATTFSTEFDKALTLSEFDESSQHIGTYLVFFVTKLKEAISKNLISEQDFSKECWEKIRLILEDTDSYINIKKKEYEIECEREQKLISVCSGKRVVIFGCGAYGNKVYDIILNKAREICFCDNDNKLWGTSCRNAIVYSPLEASERFIDCIWVIANKLHGDEIKRQLREYGIKDIYRWR